MDKKKLLTVGKYLLYTALIAGALAAIWYERWILAAAPTALVGALLLEFVGDLEA